MSDLKYWTEEEELELGKDYVNLTLSPAYFEKKYGQPWHNIKGKAFKLGYSRRGKLDLDETLVIADYNDPRVTVGQIKEKYNLSHAKFYNILHKHGIKHYKRLTPEELIALKTDYQCLKKEELVKKYNRPWSAIISAVKWHKLGHRPASLKQAPVRKEIARSVVEKIVEQYLVDKISLPELAHYHKIGKARIRKFLLTAGIVLRDDRRRKHQDVVDENYFDVIDSHNKAYLLGLFAADGYNCEEGKRIAVGFQNQDRLALEFFLKELKAKVDIKMTYNPKKKDYASINIRSEKLSQALARHGLIQRKSLVIKFPTTVADEFMSSFILGCIDGDGCIFIDKHGYNHRVDLTSTREFLIGYQLKLTQLLGIAPINLHGFEIGGINNGSVRIKRKDDLIKMFYWLYGKTDYWFDRKYQKFAKIVAQAEVRKMNREYKRIEVHERSRFKTSDDYVI